MSIQTVLDKIEDQSDFKRLSAGQDAKVLSLQSARHRPLGAPDYAAAGIPIASDVNDPNVSMRTVDLRTFNAAKDYLWPIPYIERRTNPELTQNHGWE